MMNQLASNQSPRDAVRGGWPAGMFGAAGRRALLAFGILATAVSGADPQGRDLIDRLPLRLISLGTLSGLHEIGVSANAAGRDCEALGLTNAEIERSVVGLLRHGGVKIAAPDRSHRRPGTPELTIDLASADLDRAGTMVTALVSLREEVLLVRDRSVGVAAATWQALDLMATQSDRPAGEALNLILGLVETFVEDYRAANE